MEILCHGALTVDFTAGCSSCSMTNSFVTNIFNFIRRDQNDSSKTIIRKKTT